MIKKIKNLIEKNKGNRFWIRFYAPQTFEDKDGRRIMIGWMQSWENRIIPNEFKWWNDDNTKRN